MQMIRRREGWDPFREIEDLSNRMSRLFGLGRWPGDGEREALAATDWAPSCDISESDREYRVYAELPGVKKDDVHVSLENGVLTVQGQRRELKEEKGAKIHRRELAYGNFLRRFTMPTDADESSINATFRDGLLEVVIGKSKRAPARATEVAIH